MLSYRVILDVPVQLVWFVARLLAAHRREIGTRRGTRALGCWRHADFALAWFRDRPDIARLGRGFGIFQATAYRYLDDAIEVIAGPARRPRGLAALPGRPASAGRFRVRRSRLRRSRPGEEAQDDHVKL